jgi:hypothetical protein
VNSNSRPCASIWLALSTIAFRPPRPLNENMETSALILAVINLIDPLIRLGRGASEIWQHLKNFGVDAERMRVQFKRERRQVESIRRLLLMRAEGLGVDTSIFEQFDDL